MAGNSSNISKLDEDQSPSLTRKYEKMAFEEKSARWKMEEEQARGSASRQGRKDPENREQRVDMGHLSCDLANLPVWAVNGGFLDYLDITGTTRAPSTWVPGSDSALGGTPKLILDKLRSMLRSSSTVICTVCMHPVKQRGRGCWW
jgi:hypothetical protein